MDSSKGVMMEVIWQHREQGAGLHGRGDKERGGISAYASVKFYLSISKCLWYNKKCENSDEGGSGCSKRRKEIWIIPYP